jgi:hypothetical protein
MEGPLTEGSVARKENLIGGREEERSTTMEWVPAIGVKISS